MTFLRILDPGLQTTVQDRGRFGWEHLGVASGGALDFEAYRWANRLARNRDDLAVMENVLTGLAFSPSGTVWIGVTAVDDIRVDGTPRPPWSGFAVGPGQRVEIRSLPGARSYVALRGGIDVEPVLGSRSTSLVGGFGGWQGRALRAGDELPVGTGDSSPADRGLLLRAPACERDGIPVHVRLVPWPRLDVLPPEAMSTLLGADFTITPQSNEMGVRLAGRSIPSRPGDLPSAPMPVGGVQIPPSGQPIVLLNGRGTIGGYPLIGTVVTPDVWRLGQAKPGDRIRFTRISVEDARSLTLDALQRLADATPSAQRQE